MIKELKMRWTETCQHLRLVSQTDGENHFNGLKSTLFKIQSFTSLLPGLRAVLAVLTLLLGAGVHVLQRVCPLYGQFGRVHHGQGVLVQVQPGLVLRGVLLLPRRVFLTRLVDTLHHLEGVSRVKDPSHTLALRGEQLISVQLHHKTRHFCLIR